MAKIDKVEKVEPSNGAGVPQEWVETAAYFHWEKRGKPLHDPWGDWLEAEKEVRDWLEATGALPPASGPAPVPVKKAAPKKAKAH